MLLIRSCPLFSGICPSVNAIAMMYSMYSLFMRNIYHNILKVLYENIGIYIWDIYFTFTDFSAQDTIYILSLSFIFWFNLCLTLPWMPHSNVVI